MLVRKYYAPTSREALRMVKEALGEDALILSNRRAGDGVEIMAVAPGEVEAVTMVAASTLPQPASRPPQRDVRVIRPDPRFARPQPQAPRTEAGSSGLPRPETVRAPAPTIPPAGAPQERAAAADMVRAQIPPSSPAPAAPPMLASAANPAIAGVSAAAPEGTRTDAAQTSPANYALVHEVRLLRSLVEGQLAALAWNDLKRRDAAKGEMMRQLIAAGFGAVLSREVVDQLPDGLDLAPALRMLKAALQQRLHIAPPESNLIEGGGILALVGPTGVGKTTTVAKLAAECAIKHGPAKLALVTTDTYRIGAVDQLRIYGKIIGVPVYAIRSEADLRTTLEDLSNRHLVLIDTVGMSQRDRRLAEQVGLLSGATRRVRRVLLLSAVSHLNVLEDVVRAYRGPDLAGCILTKIDEALTMGAALDALIRHRLPLHYVTNGQRVPEDLHKPNGLYLIERAFRDPLQASPLSDADLPFTLAAGQN